MKNLHELDNQSLLERLNRIKQILHQIKPSETARRLAMNKSVIGWVKVPVNWGVQRFTNYISLVEQERFILAAYEAEQSRLELERMNRKANAAIYSFEVAFQSIESDEIAQETLNYELRRRVERYRVDVGDEEFYSPCMHVPGELVVSRINKRIHSRTSLIGLIRINTARLHIRMGEIDAKIRMVDDFNDKMDEVDITTMRTRKINNSEIYEEINRKFRLEKSSQYPLFRRLQEDKKFLSDQERIISEMEKKCELLRNYIDRIMVEIKDIQREYEIIWKENNFLRTRIADVQQVPTITDYAHIMKQTKVLRHGIDIWTKRVHIAKNMLSEITRQQPKPPRRLPPLQPNDVD
ncbi:unnamed protein product [Adineta ricciae]|uniref:Uncharacterized protein n=1 Tax=Adineta ricciae TaxID=249248 RepID=A0A814DIT9_ADIRI|nr:unnamed protein product [Adineta ricciae]